MKVILTGHEDTKRILGASSWLVEKYLPKDFDVYWLNFGEYTGKLFRGKYVSLDDEQVGGVNAWAMYIKEYLKELDDEYIIYGLDDFLLAEPLNMEMYELLLKNMGGDVRSGRLSDSSFFENKEVDGSLITLGKQLFTVVGQYCIWHRETFIWLLEQCTSPWKFEEEGSGIYNGAGYKTIGTEPYALGYPDYSALSKRWKGIKTIDNNQLDIKYLKKHGLI